MPLVAMALTIPPAQTCSMSDRESIVLLESGDVARKLNCSPARVRQLAVAGQLRLVATTPRGSRLFLETDVDVLAEARRRTDAHGPEAA